MIKIFKVRNKIGYLKNMHKFCDNGSIITYFLSQTDIHIGRQTNFKLSHGNTANNSIAMNKKENKVWKSELHSKEW